MSVLPRFTPAGRRWILLSLTLLPAGSLAQAPALTLEALVTEAMKSRPMLEADRARVDAARARVGQARSGLLPRVDIQGSVTDGPLGAPALMLGGLVGTPIKKHTGASLNFVQTLLDFGRTHNLVRARRAEVTVSQEVLEADRNRVALEVKQAYFQSLQATRMLEVNLQLLEQRKQVARQADALVRAGLASRVDLELAEVQVAQAELLVVRSRNEIELTHAALSQAVGKPLDSGAGLADPPEPPGAAVTPSLDAALQTAIESRPELRQAGAQTRVHEHLASAAKATRRPLLTGVGSVGKNNPVPLFEPSDKAFAVGLAITIPVFTGRLAETQLQEQQHQSEAARQTLLEWTQAVRQQVTAARANLATAREAVRLAEAQLKRAEDAHRLATQRYQSQLASIVEVTQAQVVVAASRNEVVRSRTDVQLAWAALEFALGKPQTPPTGGSK